MCPRMHKVRNEVNLQYGFNCSPKKTKIKKEILLILFTGKVSLEGKQNFFFYIVSNN